MKLGKPALEKLIACMLIVGLFITTGLWISSQTRYTTIGLDFERSFGDRILTRYLRVRWDAGSFWVGYADHPRARHGDTLDWFDPGGTLFAPSIPPRPRSLANRLGWWSIRNVGEDPYEPTRYPGAIASRWVGIPGWIPTAFMLIFLVFLNKVKAKTQT
jgi:hypothetical protein